MKIRYEVIEKAVSVLSESARTDPDLSSMVDCLKEILASKKEFEADIIDRNFYLATILWNRGDIANALSENNVALTEDNIDAVVCNADMVESIQDEGTAAGWEAIDSAISEMIQNGELECCETSD